MTPHDAPKPLRMYMGYDRQAGSHEGACLIFAHNAKEARRMCFPVIRGWWYECQWIDVAVRWLKAAHEQYLRELQRSDEPHVIETPPVCESCQLWGTGEPDKNGVCAHCYEELE